MPTTDEGERAAAEEPAEPSEETGPSSTAAAGDAPSVPPSLINRSKRRRNLRQTRVTAVDDDADEDVDADANGTKNSAAAPSIDHSTLLEDTRAMQKQRSRRTVGGLTCLER